MADTEKTPAFDGDFDADRAKRAIEHLRAEVATLKAERDSLRGQVDDVTASKDSAAQSVKAAEERARDAERALWTEKALRRYPSVEDVADLIVGDSEEAVVALAERLAKLTSSEKAAERDAASEASEPGTDEAAEAETPADVPARPAESRPSPSLSPGHSAAGDDAFDPNAVFANVQARRSL